MFRQNRLQPAPAAKFFFAVSLGSSSYPDALHRRLEQEFGRLEEPGPIYSFSEFSSYYDAETGGTVWKYLVGVQELLSCDHIVPIKSAVEQIQWDTARIEGEQRRRTFNLDPGYVNGWQVVLATVKNQGHRIYLRSGVFCEVTLLFRKGRFEPLPWTYPDYVSPPVLEYIARLRLDYRRRLEATGAPGQAAEETGR